jgi:hypothetical protein
VSRKKPIVHVSVERAAARCTLPVTDAQGSDEAGHAGERCTEGGEE